MKKLKLKALDLGANQVLTREQMKNVLGGACMLGIDNPVFHCGETNGVTDCDVSCYVTCTDSCHRTGQQCQVDGVDVVTC